MRRLPARAAVALPPQGLYEAGAQIVSRAGKRLVMVLQAFSWSEYRCEISAVDARWPTEAQVLQMRTDSLADHASMILWYSPKDILNSGERQVTGAISWPRRSHRRPRLPG